LAVEIEPIRDARITPRALVQYPGYLLGTTIDPFPTILDGGALTLRFDGATTIGLTNLTGLTGEPKVVVGKIQQAILDFVPTLNEAQGRIDELMQITCRWDEAENRIAITSGRRGAVQAAEQSSVEVLSTVGADIAAALGLDDATAVAGRLHYHELPVPRAMLVDVRADFWTDSQAHIAAFADSANRLFPGRGSLVTQPALLARDLVDGATEILLLPEGDPVTSISMVHLEASDSPTPWAPMDRVSNRSFDVGGTVSAASGRIDLDPWIDAQTPAETLTLTVSPTPLIPSPFDAAQPAPRGMAVSMGAAFDVSPLTNSQTLGLLSLDLASGPVLRLEAVVTPNADPNLTTVEIVATSTFTGSSTASTHYTVPASTFTSGATIHASVDASTGVIELFVDGVPITPTQSTPATGTFAAGYDMTLTVGATNNPLTIGVQHLHLFSEPLGAFDARLRRTITPAGHFAPGMRVRIAETEDGVRPGTRRMETTITAVDAGTGALTVSPAIVGNWSRAGTLLFGEEYFVQQASARRRDDLVNNLYRFTVDYRVSALLEDPTVLAPQPAVETTEVVVDATGTNVPLARAPGVNVDVR
jgi:hypothetical protein